MVSLIYREFIFTVIGKTQTYILCEYVWNNRFLFCISFSLIANILILTVKLTVKLPETYSFFLCLKGTYSYNWWCAAKL